jgi:hypothetical protein
MLSFIKKLLSNPEPPAESAAGKAPQMNDLDGQPLAEGDWVEALRYDLGPCQLVRAGQTWVYQNADGQQASWAKMVDAATGFQKVRKITRNIS